MKIGKSNALMKLKELDKEINTLRCEIFFIDCETTSTEGMNGLCGKKNTVAKILTESRNVDENIRNLGIFITFHPWNTPPSQGYVITIWIDFRWLGVKPIIVNVLPLFACLSVFYF